MLSARPKVVELVFQFYGRSLHPELFEVQEQRVIERRRYTAAIKITSTGHVVTWQQPEGLVLTEVATSAQHDLPLKRRVMSHRLRGPQQDAIDCAGGVRYETDFSLEAIDSDLLRSYQEQLQLTGAKEGLLYEFASAGRLHAGAFSYIHFDSRASHLQIQAIHTFPEDGLILKSQSTFRLPAE